MSLFTVKAKSLKVFCERYKPETVYRISAKNFGLENGIKSVLLYQLFREKNFKK